MTTLIGIIAGLACILIGIFLNDGILSSFWDAPSIFIVLGGTLSTLVVSYPVNVIKDTFSAIKKAFSTKDFDPTDHVEQIIQLANTARKNGLLALEDMLESIENPFMRKGIMLIVDGSNSELVKNVLETEAYYIQERHSRCIGLLNKGSALAPAFGMVGTLIGLINMLLNLSDSEALGPSMSVALITTLYGVVIANLVFGGFATKLSTYTAYEQMQNEMIIEGILSIQDGEHPRLIRDKLESFISAKEKVILGNKLDKKDDAPEGEGGGA